MLKNLPAYLASRANHVKPLWHWSQLLAGGLGTDLDRVELCNGRLLVVEAKVCGARVAPVQAMILEALAALGIDVLLVGFVASVDESLQAAWSPAAYTWIKPGWRNSINAAFGGLPELREVIAAWRERTRRHTE